MKYLVLVFILFTYGSTDPLIASYGIQPELYWLEENQYTGVPLEEASYATIYYEPLSNQYYLATIKVTNNITYNTNNIQDEKKYIDYKMYSETPLTYIGSLNLTNRLYIDTNGNQYVKSLVLIDDTVYFDYACNKLKPLTYLVYPYARHHPGNGDVYEGVFYSNNNNSMEFYRNVFMPEKNEDSSYNKAPLREYRDPNYY